MAWGLPAKFVRHMLRIDAHQHFWKFEPVRDSWITDDMKVIRRDFGPADLAPFLKDNQFDGSVVVQCTQSEQENEFLLELANENDFIKGVVGWIDLQNEKIEERLACYASAKKMKGFRHVLQSEEERAFMMKPSFMNGISKLESFRFTYDILIHADQLKYIPEFVKSFPNQKFVIDHLAKPPIRNHEFKEWSNGLNAVAKYENVYCKISGMVTEGDWVNWKQADFIPYLDVVAESFGASRIMFGSDWPVCLVAASYGEVVEIVKEYFSSYSVAEQQLFFGGNAIRFYNLEEIDEIVSIT